MTDALTDGGHLDAAERLLVQTECPSWLYPVTMGATTVWERWDSLLPDGSVNPGEMTSFNHYALGAVADWLHRTVAGLAPDAPGYARLRIAPRPLAGLEHASARHLTPYGEASVAWHRDGAEIVVRAVVPANTTAVVELPGASGRIEVGVGRARVARPRAGRGRARAAAGARGIPRRRHRRPARLPRAARHARRDRPRAGRGRARRDRRGAPGAPLSAALMFTPPDVLAKVDEAVRAATS